MGRMSSCSKGEGCECNKPVMGESIAEASQPGHVPATVPDSAPQTLTIDQDGVKLNGMWLPVSACTVKLLANQFPTADVTLELAAWKGIGIQTISVNEGAIMTVKMIPERRDDGSRFTRIRRVKVLDIGPELIEELPKPELTIKNLNAGKVTRSYREIAADVRAACNGHPAANIPWPHRLLHEAADALERAGTVEHPKAGTLEVGLSPSINGQPSEVIINLDHDRTGHLHFSPSQAQHLGTLLFRKAYEAQGGTGEIEIIQLYGGTKVEPVVVGGFPRRNQLNRFSPAERVIFGAVAEVEKAGAHPLLTDAVNLLHKARDRVADFVDLR